MNATGPAVDVVEVIDSAPYFGWPLAITILTILIMLVDGYDLQTMAFVAPAIVADWGIARADLIWVLNGSLIGMAVGSVVLGRISDRIGRKRAFIASLLSLCAGSLLSAHAHTLGELFAWRTVTGFGLGGLTPLAATFISEWTPRRVRSIAVACAVVSVPLGGMLGAMIAQRAIPWFGWRSIFWIGTALTLLLWSAFAFNTLGLYTYANWLPTVLTSAGFTQTAALGQHQYFNFGSFFGAVGGAILIGRYGSRLVGTGLALLGVAATLLVGVALTDSNPAGPQLSLLILAAGAAFSGMQSFLYAVGAHSYPTYVRGAGVGTAQTISRIGGVLGGFAAGAFFGLRPQPPLSTFFYALGALVIMVAVSFYFLRTHIEPTRRRQ